MGESNMFEGLGDELKESEDPEPSEAEADSPERDPADSADTSEPATSDAASSTEELSKEELSKEELSTEEPSTEKPSAGEPSPDEEPQEMSDNTLSHDQPAFPFVNNYVESIYPRPETWDEFKDVVDLDLERTFREHDVRNMSGREIHDAALRLAAENPDELARIALEARGIDYES